MLSCDEIKERDSKLPSYISNSDSVRSRTS